MNHPNQNISTNGAVSGSAEDTLRLIASLPAPGGLEDRVHTGLRSHARAARRQVRVFSWPATKQAGSGWMRSAAAAAIVFVVAGGGWGIYSRVQKPESAKVIALPHGPAPGEFTNAGAMRTPNTLNGPVLAQPATAQHAPAAAPAKASAKPTPPQTAKPPIASKAKLQPAAPQPK